MRNKDRDIASTIQIKTEAGLSIRAAGSAYVVSGVIVGLPLFGYLLLPVLGKPLLWEPICILLCAAMLALVWLRSFKVTLHDGKVAYKTLFSTTSYLEYSEIATAKIESSVSTGEGRYGATVRLVVQPVPSSGKKPLIINAKVFSREDIRHLLSKLNPEISDKRIN